MRKMKQWINDKVFRKEIKTYEVHIEHKFNEPWRSYEFFIEEQANSKQEAITRVKEFIRKNANPGDNYEVVKAKRVK